MIKTIKMLIPLFMLILMSSLPKGQMEQLSPTPHSTGMINITLSACARVMVVVLCVSVTIQTTFFFTILCMCCAVHAMT